MKPILFAKDETEFTTNGLGRIDCISCKVIEERNGMYELEMEVPIDGSHVSEIEMLSLIGVVPHEGGSVQPFYVYNMTKPMNGRFKVYGRHISYRLSFIPCEPFAVSEGANACATTLAGLKSHAVEDCPFNFYTDVTTPAPYLQAIPSSIRQRLGGIEGSVLDQFGGEYEWDKWDVHLWKNRGRLVRNTGISLRYGKNITDINQEEAISETVTGIVPYWVDIDGNNLVMLDEVAVYSPLADSYPYRLTMVKDFSDRFREKPTQAQLRSICTTYVNSDDFGKPEVNIKVKFIDLWKSEEYKDIAPLEQVRLCDEVFVYFEKLNITKIAKVIKTDYDVLKERYNSIEIGNPRTTLAQAIDDNEKATETTLLNQLAKVGSSIADATAWLTSADGYVVAVKNDDGSWKELLFMNTNDPTTATYVLRINNNGIGFSTNGIAGPYNTAWTINGRFGDAANKNFWNLLTGEFSLSADTTVGGSTVQAIANAAQEAAEQTAATALANAVTAIDGDIANLQSQIDGNITSWFYNYAPTTSNPPASSWTTLDMKIAHIGDLFYDSTTGYCYRYQVKSSAADPTHPTQNDFEWVQISDEDIAAALAVAQAAQDTADSKRRIFITQPVPPYDIGDTWMMGTTGDIKTCINSRTSGSYVASDWSKLNKYTDDSALTSFISGTYATDKSNLQTQIDGKAETWYQSADPSSAWTTTALKDQHLGDLWYKTTDNTTWFYTKENDTYKWVQENVPTAVFDKIDGKAQIFISQPTPPYAVGDLWCEGSTGDIKTCVNARATGNYTASDWEKKNKYTDDTALNNFKAQAIKEVDVEYAKNQSSTTAPTSGWSTDSPQWEAGYYIWQRTKTINGNSQASYSDPVCIQGAKGQDGSSGSDGVGISSVTVTYGKSSSPSTQPSSWSGNIPTVGEGEYLWTKTYTTYTDVSLPATTTYTYAKQGEHGQNGQNGQDGTSVTVSSILYQQGDSATTAPTGTWSSNPIVVAQGKYLWTKTTYSDNTTAYTVAYQAVNGTNGTNGTNGKDGKDGTNGRGVASTTVTYGTSNSASTQPSVWGNTPPTSPDQGTWLWVKTYITYTDGQNPTTSYTKTYIGTDGDDGTSVYVVSATKVGKTTTVVFSDGTTMTIVDGTDGTNGSNGLNGYVHTAWATTVQGMDGAASTTGFSTSVSSGKKYLGTYTDNTAADSENWQSYSWSLIKGADGAAGNGIASVTITYGTSSSPSTQPSSWQTTIPSVAAGQYLWTRTVTDYTDPSAQDTVSYTYSRQGENGQQGQTGQAGTSVTVSSIKYQQGDSATTAPTGTWSDSPVTVAQGKYLWTKTTFSDNTIAYGVARQGVNGTNGQDGDDGVGVSAIVEQYYLSTSSTTQTGGSWSTNQPAWTSGKYIWTRSAVTWTNGTTTYTDPVLAKAINGANESVKNLNDSLTQTEIFNRLTNNQQNQGIYLSGTNLYINASCIKAGDLSADLINGGKLMLGGSDASSRVTIAVYDNNGDEAGSVENGEWFLNEINIFGKGQTNTWKRVVVADRKYDLNNGNSDITRGFRFFPYRSGMTDDMYLSDFMIEVWLYDSNGDVIDYYPDFVGTSFVRRYNSGTYTTLDTIDVNNCTDEGDGDYYWASDDIDKDYDKDSRDRFYQFRCTLKRHDLYAYGVRKYRIVISYEDYPVQIREDFIFGNHRGTFHGVGDVYDDAYYTMVDSVNSEFNATAAANAYINISPTEITKKVENEQLVVNTYTVTWTTSDRRAKEDIEELPTSLSKELIDATQTHRFKYRGAEGSHYGMIAQEARELLDALGETDAKMEHSMGIPERHQIMDDQRTIDYQEYIPHLINYVKDLRAEIESLKAELKKGE